MVIFSASICAVAMAIGAYTFVKHLNAFSKDKKTPSVDAWLVAVGTLGWSVLLYASINNVVLTGIEIVSYILIFIYWIGTLLQIQKHCLRLRQRLRQVKQQ